MVDHLKHVGDAAAVTAAGASFLGLLQPILAVIASMMSIAWLAVQFYDRQRKKKEGA